MIGFEVLFEGEKIIAASEESTYLFFTRIIDAERDITSLDIRGLDSSLNERYKWGSWNLKVGDEFVIKVVETDHVSQHKVTTCEGELGIMQAKLASFRNMEKRLREKGIIDE